MVSVISAASGATDRVVVLRFLPPHVSGDYFLWFELISKFWILPYVACPIVFARRLRGDLPDRALLGLIGLALAGGAAMLVGIPLVVALFGHLLPRPFNSVSLPVMIFAAGVALSAVAQLTGADLQGRGKLNYLLFSILLVLALAPFIFGLGAIWFGVAGVYAGWFVKSCLELMLNAAPYLRMRRRAQPN